MGRAPENSLKGMEQAVADGADGFECDVVLTRDGEPVVMHVPAASLNVRRQTGHRVFLDRIDWHDLQKYQSLGEPILHLDEVLEFIAQNNITCVVEPKRTDQLLVKRIVEAIKAHHVEDKVEMIAFYSHRNNLVCAKELLPSLRTSVIALWPFGDWAKICQAAKADAIVAGWKFANHWLMIDRFLRHVAEKVKRTQNQGIEVHLGLANTESDIKWAYGLGPDRLYTDDVQFLKNILKGYDQDA